MRRVVEPQTPVCPQCGNPAGESDFCGACGQRLAGQPELPTRAAWEQLQREPGAPAGDADGEREPAVSRSALRSWVRRRSPRARIAAAAGMVAVVIVTVALASGGGDAGPANEAGSQEGPTAAQECVGRWNSRATDAAKGSISILASSVSGEKVPTYVSAGFADDYPGRCLITVAQPDLMGVAQQFLEGATGTFELPTSGSISELPDSAKDWNAKGDPEGAITLGAP